LEHFWQYLIGEVWKKKLVGQAQLPLLLLEADTTQLEQLVGLVQDAQPGWQGTQEPACS
jgi:hypothetical protein